jgi:hypothetical protein
MGKSKAMNTRASKYKQVEWQVIRLGIFFDLITALRPTKGPNRYDLKMMIQAGLSLMGFQKHLILKY